MNPNNCKTCKHHPSNTVYDGRQGSHCYMFREEPKDVCMQHTGRKVIVIGDSPTGISLALIARLINHN